MSTSLGSPDAGDPGDASIWVASLLAVHDVLAQTRARYLVTVLHQPSMMPTPHWIAPDDHLRLQCSDIEVDDPDLVAPDAAHVRQLVAFAERWARMGPLVIHCMAGISRSTASAFIVLCALNPGVAEVEIARRLRAASPSAMPNRRLVAHADAVLRREGRMIAAIASLDLCQALGAPANGFRIDSRQS